MFGWADWRRDKEIRLYVQTAGGESAEWGGLNVICDLKLKLSLFNCSNRYFVYGVVMRRIKINPAGMM